MKKLSHLKLRKLIKKRNAFYRRKHITVPEDVMQMMSAIDRRIAKRGCAWYRKRRAKTKSVVERLLEKFNIQNTNGENFWRLTAICKLIGPDPASKFPRKKVGDVKNKSYSESKKFIRRKG